MPRMKIGVLKMAKFEVVLASGALKSIEADKAFSDAGVLAFQDDNCKSPKMFIAVGAWTICRCVMPDTIGYLR